MCINYPQPDEMIQPETGAKLYKIMEFDNFVKSLEMKYLYFNRVDQYEDLYDSDQPILEREKNEKIVFEYDPGTSYSNVIGSQRSRTYACCFSTSLTDYLWKNYGNICVVFDYCKLMNYFVKKFKECRVYYDNGSEKVSFLNHQDVLNVLNLNFGLVKYIEPYTYKSDKLLNTAVYSYLKNQNKYCDDSEFRITLWSIGMLNFTLSNGESVLFPKSISIDFDFFDAEQLGVIDHLKFQQTPPQEFIDKIRMHLNSIAIK